MKPATIAVGAVLIAIAALATLALPGLKDTGGAPEAAAPPAPDVLPSPPLPTPPPAGGVGATGAAVNDVPGWMAAGRDLQGGARPAAPGAAAGNAAARATATPQMRAAMAQLQSLQQRSDVEPREVSDALLAVERANGSPVMGGVRLDLLRQNMAIAEKMKAVAAEITARGGPAAEAPGIGGSAAAPQTPEATAALKARLEQLTALQKQLRTDVLAPALVRSAP